jgi:hypothetical protein
MNALYEIESDIRVPIHVPTWQAIDSFHYRPWSISHMDERYDTGDTSVPLWFDTSAQ